LNGDSIVWLGHSTILGHLGSTTFIVDPIVSKRASPLKHVGPKRFEGSDFTLEELPPIDAVLITHNHYDHLDEKSIKALHGHVSHIFTPLDNAALLLAWGVPSEKITELDWFESRIFSDLELSLAPTQHFSSRHTFDRNRSLWGSWVIKGNQRSLYVSGDSGYNTHFGAIGEKYGPFDIACLECGQYNDAWREVHMRPEESVRAAVDLKASVMLPMHWAGFDISTHAWDEPITRAIRQADDLSMPLTTPMIGQVVTLGDPLFTARWWQTIQ
jgi:L-ascorbate metabolism protein UlaG (beta-lactamase superfamily)